MIYFDAAYITRCYLKEPGSRDVAELAATVATVSACELARLEVASAFHRHLREGKIDATALNQAWQQFETDEQLGLWGWLAVTPALIQSACKRTHSLPRNVFIRSIDALHLTCAKENGFTEIYTNDRHMIAAAPLFGVKAVNILPWHDPQMERALTEIKRLLKKNPPLKPDFTKRPSLALPRLPQR